MMDIEDQTSTIGRMPSGGGALHQRTEQMDAITSENAGRRTGALIRVETLTMRRLSDRSEWQRCRP